MFCFIFWLCRPSDILWEFDQIEKSRFGLKAIFMTDVLTPTRRDVTFIGDSNWTKIFDRISWIENNCLIHRQWLVDSSTIDKTQRVWWSCLEIKGWPLLNVSGRLLISLFTFLELTAFHHTYFWSMKIRSKYIFRSW